MDSRYVIGIDFGTLSGRAVLADAANGRVLAESAMDYPHGVISTELSGKKLPKDFALEDPADYLEVLEKTVSAVVKESGVRPEEVIGLGLDVTSCTLVPVDENGTPLSFLPEFSDNPHAYVKLWKHHAAQPYADRLKELLEKNDPERLHRYGDHISSEWLFPKLAEIAEKAPEIYAAADRFLDMPDFLTASLTGNFTASACGAGYKGLWDPETGYPDRDLITALHPALDGVLETKLRAPVVPLGSRVGYLTGEWAAKLGLTRNTAVAAGNVDAHVSVPGVGIAESNALLMIMGTSTCAMLVSPECSMVSGICGVIPDGILPGQYGYEAGQPCVGDALGWFVRNAVPGWYAGGEAGEGELHGILTERASRLAPGESRLIALDWWNGNRSILDNAALSGALVGLTLRTTPEMIYRAMIESTAFGMRRIIRHYEESGVPVRKLYACGGISVKNALMMQIYADVLGREIYVSPEKQAPAKGSAMYGAAAAGESAGGYRDIYAAAQAMADTTYRIYTPDPENYGVYDRLYGIYTRLHDHFGIEERSLMEELHSF